MATITFKAKPETVYNPDDSIAWTHVKVPQLERRHCDMQAFRNHSKYGSYANSTLFPAMLARIAKEVAPRGYIRLNEVPDNVTITPGSLLATVTIEV